MSDPPVADPMETGPLFVMPTSSARKAGPVAVWITAADWAAAARRLWGSSWLVTPEGILSPEEALKRATDPDREGRAVRSWKHHLPPLAGKVASDVRRWDDARRFRDAALRGPWEGKRLPFVWQHHELFQSAGFRAARRFRAPLVLFVDAPIVWEAEQWGVHRPGWGKLLERFGETPSMRAADVVACVTLEVLNGACALGADPARTFLSPCAVDVDRFSLFVSGDEVRRRHGLEGRFVIGWSGSFRRFHGIDLAIEALVDIRRDHPEAVLLLVGDGPERPQLESRARELGVLPHVVFTGLIRHFDMPAHVAAMDVGLVLDPARGQFHYSPLKSWEYMAGGAAIVAPTSGQMGRVLTDGRNALLVEPGDAGAVARAVARLREDDALRVAVRRAAREKVVAEGSWDHRLQRLVETLHERGLLPEGTPLEARPAGADLDEVGRSGRG